MKSETFLSEFVSFKFPLLYLKSRKICDEYCLDWFTFHFYCDLEPQPVYWHIHHFQEFVGDIAGAVTSGDAAEEFIIECLGTLSNILNTNNNIDVYAVVERYNLIPCIMKILDPGI